MNFGKLYLRNNYLYIIMNNISYKLLLKKN